MPDVRVGGARQRGIDLLPVQRLPCKNAETGSLMRKTESIAPPDIAALIEAQGTFSVCFITTKKSAGGVLLGKFEEI